MSDIVHLKKMALKNNVEIARSNEFMPEWYVLKCSKSSKGNALVMANLFHESGMFEIAEPSFLTKTSASCTNDPNFNSQWGLKNTGQNGGTVGVDIKACEAWGITKGSSNITIAVFDDGVDKTHPDLTNLSPFSYDGHTSTSPSVIRGNHGTACAGIIGANSNNSLGVTGVAPGCKIMPISIKFDPQGQGIGTSFEGYANAINYAWQNGAAVISNSWSGFLPSSLMDEAYVNALTKGRNNLGTVIVFASMNNNSTLVAYPANSNVSFLVVGAISPCGQRKSPTSCDGNTGWGSNYGTTLDVVAPGVLIPTTDIKGAAGYNATDYKLDFDGTSSATPHAAALAGLILSVNPNLTQKQVVEFISRSTQKVGGYSYLTTTGRSYGTWNEEMGYGLINAKGALDLAKSTIPNYLTKFAVPRTTVLPSFFKQSSYVHVLGTGGPDMSMVRNSIFNWNLSNNQLVQFTLERNSNPYFTELKNFSTNTFNQAQPKIVINGSTGYPGLAGTYYINYHNNNVVLVEQTGKYALYFSTSATPPSLRMEDLNAANNIESSNEDLAITAYPNPFVGHTTLNLKEGGMVIVTNATGELIEKMEVSESITIGENYKSGMYVVKVVSGSKVERFSIVKE